MERIENKNEREREEKTDKNDRKITISIVRQKTSHIWALQHAHKRRVDKKKRNQSHFEW